MGLLHLRAPNIAWLASASLLLIMMMTPAFAAISDLKITEFLASNSAGLKDQDGAFSDWVEIRNTGLTPVSLLGLGLTDHITKPKKWSFPAVTLDANAYLVVFASSKNRINPLSELHTNFGLSAGGEYLGIYDAAGTTVIYDFTPTFPPQTPDVSYGINSNNEIRFFSPPTPGAANGVGTIPVATIVTASLPRGFYSAPQSIVLSSTQSSVQIRYTTNGSEPTATTGTVYTAPISILTTTVLRAAAFAPGFLQSPTSTNTYIFLSSIIAQPQVIPGYPNGVVQSIGEGSAPNDMAMDPNVVNAYAGEILTSMTAIPTMVISADLNTIFGSGGFYFDPPGDIEKKCSMEIITASGYNEQIDVGVEAHSHNRLKRSLRMNFRSEYGLREWKTNFMKTYAVQGSDSVTDTFRTMVLRAGNNRAWTRSWNPNNVRISIVAICILLPGMLMLSLSLFLIVLQTTFTEDELYRSSLIAMTDYGSHGTYVHLYLNQAYWGVYNLVERPDENFGAAYRGGKDDDWFFTNHDGYVEL